MDDIENKIREIVQEMFDANYYSGNPRVPPHTHNGIDNLPVVSAGGGTPGGNNTDIQFNTNGAFDGSDNFTFNTSTNTLQVNNISQIPDSNSPLTIHTTAPNPGDSTNIVIKTDDAQTTGGFTEISGKIDIKTGSSFLDAGNINLQTGNSITNGKGGDINLTALGGSNGNPNGAINLNALGATNNATSGEIALIISDAAGTNLDGGAIVLSPGNGSGSGMPGLIFINTGNMLLGSSFTGFGGGNGVFAIADATTVPSTNPSGGGVLYIQSGALKYRGSGGTITTLAVA